MRLRLDSRARLSGCREAMHVGLELYDVNKWSMMCVYIPGSLSLQFRPSKLKVPSSLYLLVIVTIILPIFIAEMEFNLAVFENASHIMYLYSFIHLLLLVFFFLKFKLSNI